jgi:uncharacterized C2H2 Zn-finger protein
VPAPLAHVLTRAGPDSLTQRRCGRLPRRSGVVSRRVHKQRVAKENYGQRLSRHVEVRDSSVTDLAESGDVARLMIGSRDGHAFLVQG